jgi:hypothetical protein
LLGDLFCELLDRQRPLWHVTVVHGRESGNTILFLKLHHSMVDGVSRIGVMEVLHSPPPADPAPYVPAPRPYGLLNREAIADELDKGLSLASNVVTCCVSAGSTNSSSGARY